MISAIVAGALSVPTPPVTNSYESIMTASLTGSQSTITFSSIPSTYKHLQIRYAAKTTGGTDWRGVRMTLNSDTGANYTIHYLDGSGSGTPSAGGAGGQSWATIGEAGSDQPAVSIVDILDYTNTSKNKTIKNLGGVERNTTPSIISMKSSVWLNTAAVNRIDLVTSTDQFAANTIVALYGIKG